MADHRERSVLLVDDEELVHSLAGEVLAGFEVVSAYSAHEARELASQCELDIVLLDLNLPGEDGLDLLERLRNAHPSLPVIVFSSEFFPDAVAAAIARGASGFLAKWPANLEGLRLGVQAAAGARPASPPSSSS